MIAMTYAADAFWPRLVDTHPLWLLTLSSRSRFLVLTTNELDAWSFYLVGTLRLLVSDPLFYLLGLLYGDRAVNWMERRLPSIGGYMRQLESVFSWLGYPLVVFMPNNPISLLAGATGMRPAVFFGLNLVGTVGRLYIIRVFGEIFSSPLQSFLDAVGQYRWQVLVATTALAALSFWWDWRQGTGEVQALRNLDDGLNEDERPGHDDPPLS